MHRCWRLNELHYGALQGINKAETAAKQTMEQTMYQHGNSLRALVKYLYQRRAGAVETSS